MTIFISYIIIVVLLLFASKSGWWEVLKKLVAVFIPLSAIILINIRLAPILFRSPLIGLLSMLPNIYFIFKITSPIVNKINSWIDVKRNDFFIDI